MKESWSTWTFRHFLNWYPCYRGTGGKVTHISADWHDMRVKLPLNWKTRNYVGTIFGGSFYGSVDPLYMLMLIKILGPDYIVWDKAAHVLFKKPGKSTLFTEMHLSPPEIEQIKERLESERSIEITCPIEYKDKEGIVYAYIEKLIYIRKKT